MTSRTLKFLAVSDKVLESHYSTNINNLYPKLDLLIGCGDLPYYYLDFLVSALDTRMFYVLGNHDAGRQYSAEHGELTEVRGGVDLHRHTVSEYGLTFAGLEGSMRYRPNRGQQFSESEMKSQIARLMPRLFMNRLRYGRWLDILITHSPPAGIHDQDDLTHRGFKCFLPFLRTTQPRFMLHGHIHRYNYHKHEITKYHETSIINVYPKFLLEVTI